MDKQREHIIGFLEDTAEEFTNNQRERDVRMVKVEEKISGGFRSDTGAAAFCALAVWFLPSVNRVIRLWR